MLTIFKDFLGVSPKSILTFISLATVKNDVNQTDIGWKRAFYEHKKDEWN